MVGRPGALGSLFLQLGQHLLGPADDLLRHAGQLGHLDTEAVIGPAPDDAPQEGDVVAPLLHGDVEVLHPGELALQGVDIAHRKGGFAVEGLLTAQMQAIQQVGHQGVAGVPLDLQADGGQPGALFEDLAHVLAVVVVDVVILILRGDVRVPGDGDDRLALHGVLVKDISHVFQHKLLDEHIAQAAFVELEVGGDDLGNGHDAETALAVPLQGHGDVQGLAGQVGEGVVGVHHLWGEDGQHIVPEVPLTLLALLYVQLLDGKERHRTGRSGGSSPGSQRRRGRLPSEAL